MSASEISPFCYFDQAAETYQLSLWQRYQGNLLLRWFQLMRSSEKTRRIAVKQAFLAANLKTSGFTLDTPGIPFRLARALLETVAATEPTLYTTWRRDALERKMDLLELKNPHVQRLRAASRGILPPVEI